MRVRVKKTIMNRDGVICFTAGKVYQANEEYYVHRDDYGRTHPKLTGLVSTCDDRGEPSALMFSEFEVTCEDRYSNYP